MDITNEIYYKPSITAMVAQEMVNAAILKAKEINQPMVIAILDESAHLKAFHRMDGASLISIELAQNKAYTAVTHPWDLSTNEIFQHIQANPATFVSVPNIPRYVMFDGGYVIKINDKVIGGLGISGGKVDQDAIVAHAALAVCQDFHPKK